MTFFYRKYVRKLKFTSASAKQALIRLGRLTTKDKIGAFLTFLIRIHLHFDTNRRSQKCWTKLTGRPEVQEERNGHEHQVRSRRHDIGRATTGLRAATQKLKLWLFLLVLLFCILFCRLMKNAQTLHTSAKTGSCGLSFKSIWLGSC